MSRFLNRLVRRMLTWQGITLSIVMINLVGMIGLKVMEPQATWLDSVLWTTMALWTFGLDMFAPTSVASRVFQAAFLQFAFPVTVVVATLAIPPFVEFREAPKKGLAEIDFNRYPLYLVVAPVDWEKVQSVYDELFRRLGKKFQLLVVAETLAEIPDDLHKLSIQYVAGSLRDDNTFLRAGLNRAKGVFVCASSYQDIKADNRTSGTVEIIEQLHPAVRSVVEVVSRDSLCLFSGQHAADHTVVFDPTVLAKAFALLASKLVGHPTQLIYPVPPADDAQAGEMDLQISAVRLQIDPNATPVQLILPSDLDKPSQSDYDTKAYVRRARAEGIMVIGIYLSVRSKRLFKGYESHVICADEVMASAIVDAMLQ